MELFGRAKQWVRGRGPITPEELQPFRVACPEGHVIRGRRTEGYQAIRCPECGAGVFVLPMSPLPAPPIPSSRAEAAPPAAVGPVDDAPIPLSDHIPEATVEEEDIPWLEPVEPGQRHPEPPLPALDPVEAAVSELPDDVPEPPPAPRGRPSSSPRPVGDRPSRRRPRPSPAAPGRIPLPHRPSLGDRLRSNRPALVGLAVLVVLLGTVSWTLHRNQRRDYPALVQRGREEGIPALDRGEFDRAHRLLARAAEAVDALRGQIGGAEEVRQAAREAAIYVDLIPDRLEEILDRRARTSDESEWRALFDRSYKGRSILISGEVTSSPASGAGTVEVNYRILAVGPLQPRVARLDFEGFRLFEASPPEVGSQVQFGARLSAIEAEPDGWRFRLDPDSGVFITHFEALEALGWTPLETADRTRPPNHRPASLPNPLILLSSLTPWTAQGLEGQTRDQVLGQLGAPQSFARSAAQGEFLEQWIYLGPSGSRQYINFVQSTSQSGPAVVDRQFSLR
ncbi:hypothetical protein [Tautonia sociabilis]|uniref:hypothetical protein n=1 Tax=Tautonia sociabilis TaxID=2080755 RepID=UPI0013152F4E|nr:hypothetical protein [Tautonia sociabilis]